MNNLAITLDVQEGTNTERSLPVVGRVWPAHTFVQVLVLSADNRWYTQKLCTKHGNRFKCDAKIGFQEPNAKNYTIAAGIGPRILDASVADLPTDGYLWTSVVVDRV